MWSDKCYKACLWDEKISKNKLSWFFRIKFKWLWTLFTDNTPTFYKLSRYTKHWIWHQLTVGIEGMFSCSLNVIWHNGPHHLLYNIFHLHPHFVYSVVFSYPDFIVQTWSENDLTHFLRESDVWLVLSHENETYQVKTH